MARMAATALMVGPLTITGVDAEGVKTARERTRQLLTFLYSTPAYWPSLELFGWRERGERLHQLTREGRWNEMAGLVDDDMLGTFAPEGSYDEIASVLREWYGDVSHWITFPIPDDPDRDPEAQKVIARLQGE